MANKEKVIDLKQRPDKVSQEHLGNLQKLVNTINGLQFNIGKIETQKHNMLHDLAMANDKVIVMQDTLQKEYGSFDIDLKDGTINWPKDEK